MSAYNRKSLSEELQAPYHTFCRWLNDMLTDEDVKAKVGKLGRIISPGQAKTIKKYWEEEQ